MTPAPVTVAIAAYPPLLLEGIVGLLDRECDVEVVAAAADGDALLAAVRLLPPDVVVTAIDLPMVNGVEATRRLRSEVPLTRVVCFSARADEHSMTRALDAGAAGYVCGRCGSYELVEAVRTVATGRSYLCGDAAGAAIQDVIARHVADSTSSSLTPREREILQLIAEGLSTNEIATRLVISHKTVGTHREHVLRKLGLRSVAGLTRYAIREGLTSVDFAGDG